MEKACPELAEGMETGKDMIVAELAKVRDCPKSCDFGYILANSATYLNSYCALILPKVNASLPSGSTAN